MQSYVSQLDNLVGAINAVASNKNYWLIRTQAGALYQTFIDNSYISIGHKEVSSYILGENANSYKINKKVVLDIIRNKVKQYHEDNGTPLDKRSISLISSQIAKFAYEVKENDIVIIPSHNSNYISFGIVTENYHSHMNVVNSYDSALLKKPVVWIKELKRRHLDPYLYKMFTAHQAINNVKEYAAIVERSLNDMFILEDEAHFVINIESEDIVAKDLFGLGTCLLDLLDDVSNKFNLGVNSKDLQVAININSPGKIDIKSKVKKTTILFGIILLLCGGGYMGADGTKLSTDGLPGIIKAIDEFLTHRQERELKDEIFHKYRDSLQIKQPEDMLMLLKQVSENKDCPK